MAERKEERSTVRRPPRPWESALYWVAFILLGIGLDEVLLSAYQLPRHSMETGRLFAMKDFALISALRLIYERRMGNPHAVLNAFSIGGVIAVISFLLFSF